MDECIKVAVPQGQIKREFKKDSGLQRSGAGASARQPWENMAVMVMVPDPIPHREGGLEQSATRSPCSGPCPGEGDTAGGTASPRG